VLLELEPVVPDLRVPRAHPCSALRESTRRECGVTPAQLYRVTCAHRHSRDVWLCGVDAAVTSKAAASGMAACRECASRGHRCPAALVTVPEVLDLIRSRA
jgi:hypothetical protein